MPSPFLNFLRLVVILPFTVFPVFGIANFLFLIPRQRYRIVVNNDEISETGYSSGGEYIVV